MSIDSYVRLCIPEMDDKTELVVDLLHQCEFLLTRMKLMPNDDAWILGYRVSLGHGVSDEE